MSSNNLLIYVIVVTYNGSRWIDKCFGSLLESSIPVKVLAIDNASTDSTPVLIREKFKSVTVIETGANLGFGKANNIGLQIALENNADYAFLLNQDAWIKDNDTIFNLINIHQKNNTFFILSPIHLAGSEDALDGNFSNNLAPSVTPNFISDMTLNQPKQYYETTFVNAAAWLMSKECIETIGGFDPLFSHYGEDDDYARRINYHAYKIGIVPQTYIIHDRPNSLRREGNTIKAKNITNLLLVKNLSHSTTRCIISFILTSKIEICNFILRFQFSSAKISLISYFHTLAILKKIRASNKTSMRKHPNYL